jgi:tetratricopeptide (TPR) repeat protein
MNSTQIHITFKAVINYLNEGKIKNALDYTAVLVAELQMGVYSDLLSELNTNYRLMLEYYVAGAEDPQRKIMYNKLISRIYILISELREELLLRNSTNFEYTQKRFFPFRRLFESVNELYDSLNYYHKQNNPESEFFTSNQAAMSQLRKNFEINLSELFALYWLTTHYDQFEKNVFRQLMDNSYPGLSEKSLLVSALTLNLWRMFDEQKLMMLFDCIENTPVQVSQRAMVGLCFVLTRYNRFLPYFPSVRNRLVLLADNQHYQENFRNIIIQIIATLETDKISKKLREEILPEIMKISPALKDKLEAEKLLKSDEWDEQNPEWQDILEESGVYDKIKELTDLQLEGADVYMSTFSMLKSFAFFNEISHWFLLFDSRFTDVNPLFSDAENSFVQAFTENNIMCNSDKFSFCLSMLQMPEAQSNMIKNSFKAESEQLRDMNSEELILHPDLAAKNISKQYVQDLFRFFRLHPNRADFSDMFSASLLLHKTYLFDILSDNSDLKSSIAEYYFLKGHYKEAIEVFEELKSELENPSASIFQKIGFAYQKTSQLQKALEAYLMADVIQPDDLWTVRKIALCYRLSGNYEKALAYYQHCIYIHPGHLGIELNISKCLMLLNRYAEALKLLYRLDAENEGNLKIMRHLCWCNFVSGNIEKAKYHSKEILKSDPQIQDNINAGHIHLCNKNISEAIKYYVEALKKLENKIDDFIKLFKEDKNFLIANGIETYELNLVLDALQFEFKQTE